MNKQQCPVARKRIIDGLIKAAFLFHVLVFFVMTLMVFPIKWFDLKLPESIQLSGGTTAASPEPQAEDWLESAMAMTTASLSAGQQAFTDGISDDLAESGADDPSTRWIGVMEETPIRHEPKEASPEILIAKSGDWLPVIREDKQWVEVKLGETQTGWLQSSGNEQTVASDELQVLQFAAETPLFNGPDLSFSRIATAEEGSFYLPRQVSGQWIELVAKNRRGSLWVQADEAAWAYGQANGAAAASVSIASAEGQNQTEGKLAGRTVVVDPGHGGRDPGAIAGMLEVYERDINLAAALALKNKLEAAGAHVIMTRTTNEETVSLEKRAEISTLNNADFFISIHQNTFGLDPSVSGAITFYSKDDSQQAALFVEEEVIASIGGKNERQRVEKQSYAVLRNNVQPAVLVEGCFLSNPDELVNSLLTSYHEKLATGIYYGILKWFENE